MKKQSQASEVLIGLWQSAVARGSSGGDDPSNDPDYSEFWVETQPFQEAPQPEPDPPADPGGDPGGDAGGSASGKTRIRYAGASATSNEHRTLLRAIKSLDTNGWSEEVWTEISPPWAEMAPPVDPGPPDDPGPADPGGGEGASSKVRSSALKQNERPLPDSYYEMLLHKTESESN